MVREFLKNHKWLQEDMDMKRFTALIASAALVLSGYSSNVQVFAAAADSETDENIWETVEDAYVYAFPLVLMDATETSATNTEEAVTGKAPVNQFIHSVALANAQFRNVVTPNVDTIYSQVWYDLSEEPMVCFRKQIVFVRFRFWMPGQTLLQFLIRQVHMQLLFLRGKGNCQRALPV